MAVLVRSVASFALFVWLVVPGAARASDPDPDDAAQTGQLAPAPDAPRDLAVAGQDEAARSCWTRAAGRRGADEARVTVAYRVVATGAVREVRVVEPSARGAARRCALGAVRRHRLAAADVTRELGARPEERVIQHTFVLPAVEGPLGELTAGILQGDAIGEAFGFGGLGLGSGGVLGSLRAAPGDAGLGGLGLGGQGTGSGQGLGTIGTGGRGTPSTGSARVTVGTPVVRGSLSADVVRRVLSSRRASFAFCLERALVRDSALAGTLSARLLVDAGGAVTTTTLGTSGPANAELRACVTRTLSSTRFPAPSGGGVVIVQVPLVLGGR